MKKIYLTALAAIMCWQAGAASMLPGNSSMMVPPDCELITPVAATASSGDAGLAIDGIGGTRWESAFTDPQTLTVDLGVSTYVSAVSIDWEAANAKDYTLSGSVNGTDWVTIGTYTDMPAGARTDVIADINAEYRYLQMNGTARNLTYGYSIFEFHVCSTQIEEPEPSNCNPVTAQSATATSGAATAAAIDGNHATRWESEAGVDPQSITVDIGEVVMLSALQIHWETANAKDYTVSGSVNGTDWVTIGTYTDMPLGDRTDEIEDVDAEYRYIMIEGTARNTIYGYSIWEITLCGPTPDEPEPCEGMEIASATATSGDAAQAIDANENTRWESEPGVDPQMLTVDLGAVAEVHTVRIHWETANAKDYTLSGSENGTDWVTIGTYTDMAEGDRTDVVEDIDAEYRYIRMEGTARNTIYGYSIWEFTVCGEPAEVEPEPCEGLEIVSATATSGDAAQAIDANENSRWESEPGVDPQVLTVDLGAVAEVHAVWIHWETANAKDYTLSGSENGTDWVTIGTYTDMAEGDRTDIIENIDAEYRYIRMEGTARNTVYGYSIWEFTVCGEAEETVEEYTLIPAHIEAEDYNDMMGVDEEATGDEGGGESVGWIDAGDWMDYNIDVPEAGSYEVALRIASALDTGVIELFSGTQSLGTVNVPNTGGWQVWQTITATVTLPEGEQVFRISAAAAGFNINWMEFSEAGTNSTGGFKKQLLGVYPNPAEGFVNVEVENDGEILIFNSLGALAGRVAVRQGTNVVSLENYASGLYLLNMNGNVFKLLVK